MSATDQAAIWLTLKLAVLTTVILLILATPLAWWLSRSESRLKAAVEAVVALPLVLPPTVVGFYFLVAFSPASPLGSFFEKIVGMQLAFSFPGLVLGSVIYSLPFAVGPIRDGFTALGRRPLEVAATLGASGFDRFFSVVLPSTWPAYLTAAVLTFAHVVGEFGIVLMIGGNIPGRTQVVSTVIYNHVEALRFGEAHTLALGLLGFSFLILFAVYFLRRRAQPLRF